MANTMNLDLENVNTLSDSEYVYDQLVTEIITKINANNLKIDELPNNFIAFNQKGVANGIATLGNDSKIPLIQLPNDIGSIERVGNISERDSIVKLYDNKMVFVIDASADTTITSGWAMYIYNSSTLLWVKIVDEESLDISITWNDIVDKPTVFPPEPHTHAQIGTNADSIVNLENNKVDKITDSRLVSETEITVFNDKYSKTEVDNKLSALETNIDWKESVATFVDIATTYPTPVDGWTVNTKDTDYTYRYNGTSWVTISANAIPKATTLVDGLMSKEDKLQLEANKTDILTLENGKIDKTQIVNNTTTGGSTNVASAETVKTLGTQINNLEANKADLVGGKVPSEQLPEMDYITPTDNTKDNIVSFIEASTDTDIKTNETHSTLFGKILKSIKTLRTSISNIINGNTTVAKATDANYSTSAGSADKLDGKDSTAFATSSHTHSGYASTSHASTGTGYGVGTTSNYGHVKVRNDLNAGSFANGEALSGYQGKVLKSLIDNGTHVTGSYTGNGVDNREINVGFQPSFCIIAYNSNYIFCMKNTFSINIYNEDHVSSSSANLSTNGFTVGTYSGGVNYEGIIFNYIAFK